MVTLYSRGAAAQFTCGFPASGATLPPPCISSWLATPGFVVTGDIGTGPTSVTATGASATTSFNLNQLSLTNTSTSGNTQGESRFLDTFTVTGGSGAGSITFYWAANGALQQFAPPANCDPFRDGVDFGVSAPSGTIFAGLTSTTLPLCAADTRAINRSGSFSVTFTYGFRS